jgi:flagellar assembly factor FliW
LNQESPYYRFPEGIPAFEQHVSFRLTRDPAFDPLLFLVSERDPELRFICIQARFLAADYSYELDAAGAAILGAEPGRYSAGDERFGCLAILSFPAGAPATANLLAPVVINFGNAAGLQAVQSGGAWSHAHPVGVPEDPQCS